MGDSEGQASALKMCYAAYTKGTSALLCAILAASEALQVRQELMSEWYHFGPNFTEQTTSRVQRVTAKAWRFEGEMLEIASTFDTVGLPAGFHLAASEIYSRISGYKDLPLPELAQVLSSLLEEPPGGSRLSRKGYNNNQSKLLPKKNIAIHPPYVSHPRSRDIFGKTLSGLTGKITNL